jgi:GNAT superfamily N-acetyltransferase
MANYRISVDDTPAEADIRQIIQYLVSYNNTKAEKENWQALAVFIRDERCKIVGGLNGYTHWSWLYISHLWIAGKLRGRGYGTELVSRAEQVAIKRGCQHAYLDTYDFQALSFYQKLRYQVFGVLHHFPLGHARYFLQKSLLQAHSN